MHVFNHLLLHHDVTFRSEKKGTLLFGTTDLA
jgi:hypothetical protein